VTEAEWLACADPAPMVEFLMGKASDRKLRLFACTCCRRVWHLLTDARSRRAVEVIERYVDGLATEKELDAASDAAIFAADELNASSLPAAIVAASSAPEYATAAEGYTAHAAACAIAYSNYGDVTPGTLDPLECVAQSALLRDLFVPFRPVTLDPAWRTPTATALATAAYEERHLPAGILDTQRLAVLADAIEYAGCTDEQILAHLRGPGPHIRGCWVIDLLLGKE